jgi:hypothetical protein
MEFPTDPEVVSSTLVSIPISGLDMDDEVKEILQRSIDRANSMNCPAITRWIRSCLSDFKDVRLFTTEAPKKIGLVNTLNTVGMLVEVLQEK